MLKYLSVQIVLALQNRGFVNNLSPKGLNPLNPKILVSKAQICRPAGTFIPIPYCAGLKTRR